MSNCVYTAQGMFVCSAGGGNIKEPFVVRDDPNEKGLVDWCSPIHNNFLEVAKKNVCDIKVADTSNCEFHFVCRKPT
mgnify:CR=1 FL=1